jgi:ParB family chromosome partitioning protein
MPIVVATADAYLRDRPERADDLDSGAQYVVVDGHRRLECARRIGLATIPVRVDNARVATDEALLEAAFVANYHRDDMTELEEAHALKTLVDYYGSQTKAAKRLGIPQGTISTKLSLLKLAPDLQKDLMTGERKVEHVRNLGKLSPEEQRQKADERAREARAVRRTPTTPEATPEEPTAPASAAGPADYHAVIIAEERAASPAVSTDRPEPSGTEIPEPRSTPVAEAAPAAADEHVQAAKPPRPFPYDDPALASQLCWAKMKQEDYLTFARMTLRTLRAQRPEEFDQLTSELGL